MRQILFMVDSPLGDSDRTHLFEIGALLINYATRVPEQQAAHLESFVRLLLNDVEALIGQAQLATHEDTRHFMGNSVALKLSYLVTLSKSSSRDTSHLSVVYGTILQVSVKALTAMVTHPMVRSKFMVVLHRMVSCLDNALLLDLLPQPMELLVSHQPTVSSDMSTESDVEDLVAMVNQLMIKYHIRLGPVLEPLLMVLLSRLVDRMPSDDKQQPHDRSIRLAMQRHYFLVLQHVAAHGLSPVLLGPTNRPHLETLLNTVVCGIRDVDDPMAKKTCISTVVHLSRNWLSPTYTDPAIHAAFTAFVMDQVVPTSLQTIIAPGFRRKDPGCVRVVGEVAVLLRELAIIIGPSFTQSLVNQVLPAYSFPSNLLQEVGNQLKEPSTSLNADGLRKVLREGIQAMASGHR